MTEGEKGGRVKRERLKPSSAFLPPPIEESFVSAFQPSSPSPSTLHAEQYPSAAAKQRDV